MDVLENEDQKSTFIALEEFQFICRICCSRRNDLSLFQENYLLDLFQAIMNVNVHSNVEYPRNICNGCINELEDISVFINISKYNDASCGKKPEREMIRYNDEIESGILHESKGTSEKSDDDMSLQGFTICRICFSPSSSLTSFAEKTHLVHLFLNITNIDVKAQTSSSEINCICYKCINQLEKISSFINSSQLYDQKLENALNRNKAAKIKSYLDPIDIKLPTHEKLELECEIDNKEATNRNICTDERFVYESSEKLEIIDIKEEVIDRELVASTEQCYQNCLHIHYKFPTEEIFFDGAISKEALEEFPSSMHIQNHDSEDVTTQSGKKLFECNWCKMRFSHNLTWQQHLLTHTKERPFKCDCCNKTFSKKWHAHLRHHMVTHTGQKPFECDSCDKRFTKRSGVKRHMVTHTGKRPFKCDGCEKTFASKSNLQKHMVSHTGKKPFKCDGCEKTFATKSNLQQHMVRHTGKKPFKCDRCEKCFSLKSLIQQHMATHTGDKPFRCDSCEKRFARKSTLTRHTLTHIAEKPFRCDDCNKTFAEKSHWQHHMLTHTGKKPFKCDGCEKSFTWKSTLRLHRLTHSGEEPFKCGGCERSFVQKSHLQHHMHTHTGKKPFKCDSCDKIFAQKSNLQHHMHSHTGGKPYKCDSCKKTFTRKSSLSRHMLTHTGKPFGGACCDNSIDAV